jgi:hypothetical protein
MPGHLLVGDASHDVGSFPLLWPPANDTSPVVQDFVRCCLDNKPLQHLKNQPDQQ